MSAGTRQQWNVVSDAWRTQLWPLPTIAVLLAVALGVVLPRLDAHVDSDLPRAVTAYLFTGGPTTAGTVLTVVAGSLITVASLTFSLTLITLQLLSNQFSPRLLRTFTRDRFVHVTLALLLATFTYAVSLLRTIRSSLDETSAFVPQISMTAAFLLGLASVVTLIVFLAHIARQIRAESVLLKVRLETAESMRKVLTRDDTDPADPPQAPATGSSPLLARSSGFINSTDEASLLAAAVTAGAVIAFARLPGDFMVAGTPIAVAWATGPDATLSPAAIHELESRLADGVRVGFERTGSQDVAFGLRQLVDVAIKALSPGINEPTTAVVALCHAAALLADAADCCPGPRLLRDDAGTVRVVLPRPDFPALLELVIAQPCHYGATDPSLLTQLLILLRQVAWSTRRPTHQQAVAHQVARIQNTAARQAFDHTEQTRLDHLAHDVHLALTGKWPPDRVS